MRLTAAEYELWKQKLMTANGGPLTVAQVLGTPVSPVPASPCGDGGALRRAEHRLDLALREVAALKSENMALKALMQKPAAEPQSFPSRALRVGVQGIGLVVG